MLTLYIMETHHKDKCVADLYLSVSGLWIERLVVGTVDEINEDKKDTDWFLILFDNEKVSPDLRDAISTILEVDPKIDAFIFMEKTLDGKLTQSPRMFRRHVELQKDSFLPVDNGYKYERILDGWVKKNVA